MGVAIALILIVVFGGSIALAIFIVGAQSRAKKQALKMLAEGMITDRKRYDRILKVLATSKDAEAPDICRRLRELDSGAGE